MARRSAGICVDAMLPARQPIVMSIRSIASNKRYRERSPAGIKYPFFNRIPAKASARDLQISVRVDMVYE